MKFFEYIDSDGDMLELIPQGEQDMLARITSREDGSVVTLEVLLSPEAMDSLVEFHEQGRSFQLP